MSTATHDAAILNGLIATLLDSVDGYRAAAEDVDTPVYARNFAAHADVREGVVTGLQDAVRALGGTPQDRGTALAGAHRMFMGLKALVSSRDEQAVLNEVARGEAHLKSKFDAALADTAITDTTRTAIRDAWARAAPARGM